MMSQFSGMKSPSNFVDVVLFLFSSLVTGPSFMSVSLCLFMFIMDIPPEFRPISGDWGEIVIPALARMFLMKRY